MKYYFDNTNIPLSMTKKDEEKFNEATASWLCKQSFTTLSLMTDINGKVCGKVRDLCHLTVKFISITYGSLRIVDSIRYLQGSLESLDQTV